MVSSRFRVLGEPTSPTRSGVPRYVHVGEHAGRGFIGYVDQIGHDDVEVRKHDIRPPVEHASNRMVFEVTPQKAEEVARDLLVSDVGRRRHIVLSVDQLVSFAIVWKQHEVVVACSSRQDAAVIFMESPPAMRLILASSRARRVPTAVANECRAFARRSGSARGRFRVAAKLRRRAESAPLECRAHILIMQAAMPDLQRYAKRFQGFQRLLRLRGTSAPGAHLAQRRRSAQESGHRDSRGTAVRREGGHDPDQSGRAHPRRPDRRRRRNRRRSLPARASST